jgi:putative transposase
LEDGSREVLGI